MGQAWRSRHLGSVSTRRTGIRSDTRLRMLFHKGIQRHYDTNYGHDIPSAGSGNGSNDHGVLGSSRTEKSGVYMSCFVL